jgi:hypothetical protein
MVDIDDYILSTPSPEEYITKFITPLLKELGVKGFELSTIGEGLEGPWPPIREEEANFFFNQVVVSSSIYNTKAGEGYRALHEFKEPFDEFKDRLLALLNLGPDWKNYSGNIFYPKSDEVADRQEWIDTKILKIRDTEIEIYLPLISVKTELDYIEDENDYSLMGKGEFLGISIYFGHSAHSNSFGKNNIRCNVKYVLDTIGKGFEPTINNNLIVIDSLNINPYQSFMNWNKNPFATLK